MSVLEVIQCCGWRMEVRELFAFCQPVTLVSEPSFISHTSLNITIASCAFCLWPSLTDGWGFKLCLLSYWLNLSQYCMCVHTFLFAHKWVQCVHFHAYIHVCVVRANLCATVP